MWVKQCHEPILAIYSSFMGLIGHYWGYFVPTDVGKQCHKPPIISIPPIKMVMSGAWFNGTVFYPHSWG